MAASLTRGIKARFDQMILDAVRRDVLALMRTEHDPGDEDLRGCNEFAENHTVT